MQYIITAIAFNIGKPFKKPSYTNWMFTLNCLILIAFAFYATLIPDATTMYLLDVTYAYY